MQIARRTFLKSTSALAGAAALHTFGPASISDDEVFTLPGGTAPEPVAIPHFPDRLHAFVWRNWTLVPVEKLARVVGATPDQIRLLGKSMGLPEPAEIGRAQERRSYITVIRRNWHLLPYAQLLELLGWTPEHMAYMLREDDFLFIKLGSLKPRCSPLRYTVPSSEVRQRAREIAEVLKSLAPDGFTVANEPLFSFVSDLSAGPPAVRSDTPENPRQRNRGPRFCYSYFALYGDPLLEPDLDPYPDGYLQRLAAIGVNGVWLQGVLQKLSPLPWFAEDAGERKKRLENLRALARKAARHGIGIYLYLNEPRALPQKFFAKHPEIKGVSVGDYACVCTSTPQVRNALRDAIASVLAAVPELAGFFTISASENPTNCWSHGAGTNCPRCGKRSAAEVIAEVNATFYDGIQRAREKVNTKAQLIVWDWGWRDDWSEELIKRLPSGVILQSVSEWSIPIKRGGIDSVVGEYSISVVGPGPRAKHHWDLARKRGLRTTAKIQAGNTWELSAVPYIPALANVALHASRLKEADVDGLMLGWTLGGYPSPNLQVACEIADAPVENESIEKRVNRALRKVAVERFGPELAEPVVRAWIAFSAAFSEFPYHGGLVYNAPMQYGPANLLWLEPTGYRATMVGFPYDDLDSWRQVYPAEVFIQQFNKIADGFDAAIDTLKREAALAKVTPQFEKALELELNVATAAAIHFRSTANQAHFVYLRRQMKSSGAKSAARLKDILRSEIALARQLHQIQSRDSRIGFEATNQYYYVPQDLLEKIINCEQLLNEIQ